MARPLRIDYPETYYHVLSRGNEQRPIFKSDRDYEKFLELLEKTAVKFHIEVHAYVLMKNHYHHARMDAPTALQHIVTRGNERRKIFRDVEENCVCPLRRGIQERRRTQRIAKKARTGPNPSLKKKRGLKMNEL